MDFEFNFKLLVDDSFDKAPIEVKQKYLMTRPLYYELLTYLAKGPLNYFDLINKINSYTKQKEIDPEINNELLINSSIIDEQAIVKHLNVLLKYELISYLHKNDELLVLSNNINSLMRSLRDELLNINGESYFAKLIELQKPKTNNIYYDFPVKGKAIKKVSLTPNYFDFCKELADKITKDFNLT